MNIDTMDVTIVRQKGDYRKDTVKCRDIRNLRWSKVSGGQRTHTGTYDLYGDVYCTYVPNIPHTGNHRGLIGKGCPHNIKVCILKKDNPNVYEELAKRAGEKPKESWRDGVNVSEEVRNIVSKKPGILATEVAEILEGKGIDKDRTRNAIRYLKKNKFKEKGYLESEKHGTTQKLTLHPPV